MSNDNAGAPGTEIEALLQNGRCPHVFFSDNMRKCFGFENRVGKVTVAQFAVPWWWRTDFAAPARAGRDAKLIINGVIGAANVWVNGHKVAGAGQSHRRLREIHLRHHRPAEEDAELTRHRGKAEQPQQDVHAG